MKKTQDIIGLPIINISNGNDIGKVKSYIANSKSGAIDFIVVDSGLNVMNTRVISSNNVVGIGEYALTILNESSMDDLNSNQEAIELLKSNVLVKNTKVLTKKGSLIGETVDFFFDEDNHLGILAVEFIDNYESEKIKIIPRDYIITFGENLLVVENEIKFCSDVDEYRSYLVSDEIVLKNTKNAECNKMDSQNEITKNELNEEELNNQSQEFKEMEFTTVKKENVDNLFEIRQKQYLNGRRTTKTIYDNIGNILVNEGIIICDEIVDIVKQNGKLIELVMNNRA
jgi:uncharacterized protein YrrD